MADKPYSMETVELWSGQEVQVPSGFAEAADRLGMSKRQVQGVGTQETVTVLAPNPMGPLPNQVSSEPVPFAEALKIAARTPLEPFRLAVEDTPGLSEKYQPTSMGEAMSLPEVPPTVAIPEDTDVPLPFDRREMSRK